MVSLNTLPPELWHQIISLSVQSPTINALRHLEGFNRNNYDVIRRKQTYLLGLQQVCRALYPFVEEFLYEEVLIYGNQGCEAFIRNASLEFSGSRRYGKYTKSIYVRIKGSQSVLEPKISFLKACPNLLSFDVSLDNPSGAGGVASLIYVDSQSYSHLSSFGWTGTLQWLDFHQLSVHHAKVVSLRPAKIDSGLGSITFPSVRYLSINDDTGNQFDNLNIDLPLLRHLSIHQKQPSQLGFLFRQGYKLITLELIHSPLSLELVVLWRDLFIQCPKLKTLAFSNAWARSQPFAVRNEGWPLSTLVISLEGLNLKNHLQYLKDHAECFHDARFPNLLNVILIRRNWEDTIHSTFETEAKELFPHATVELRRGDYSLD